MTFGSYEYGSVNLGGTSGGLTGVNVSSTPSGATVYIDEILQAGVTPTTVINLASGSHTYTLSLSGYADATGTFSIRAGQTIDLNITFAGSLSISSTPSGAEIFIDDIDRGVNTPNIITGLLSGLHNVKLTLTNYYDWIGTTDIIAGQTTILGEVLIPKPGSLNISSTPSGAEIFIDNIDTGLTTPIIIGGISPGNHTFRLSHLDYDDVTGSFDIYINQITIITATLSEIPGVPHTYGIWDPSGKARLRVYKCKKIDIEQTFFVDAPTLSFDYIIKADADPEIIRWLLIVGGTIVINETLPSTPYGISTGHTTKDVSTYIGSNATIKFYAESGPDCESVTHENTYLYLDNVKLL